MFVCDDGSLPFLGAGYTTELRLSSGFGGKPDGKLLTGMKNHFDTAEFSSQASSTQTRSIYNKIKGKNSGMDDHFDTSSVFEISKFDISKFACILFFLISCLISMVKS